MIALVVPSESFGPQLLPHVGKAGDVDFGAGPWPPTPAAGLIAEVFVAVDGSGEHALSLLVDDPFPVGRSKSIGLARDECFDFRRFAAADAVEFSQLGAPDPSDLHRRVL